MNGTPPDAEGVASWDRDQGAAPVPGGVAVPARSLGELSREFVFFNHGLLHSAGGLDRNVVAIHRERTGCDVALHVFERPIFRGVTFPGSDPWDHVLGLVAREDWLPLMSYLAGVGVVDRARRRCAWGRPKAIRIVDPIARRGAVVPPRPETIEVVVFDLDASWGEAQFVPHVDAWDAVAEVAWRPPTRSAGMLAAALLAEEPRPFARVDAAADEALLTPRPRLVLPPVKEQPGLVLPTLEEWSK